MTKSEIEVRVIDVQPGDVFLAGCSGDLVVTKLDGEVGAWCRYTITGKRTNIQVSRLQRDYARAGTVATARALRKLAALDKAARK